MTVYTCMPDFESMMTCIYTAWASGLGHKNIRLELEPVGQYTLMEQYIHVDADSVIVDKVSNSIITKISNHFYNEITYCLLGFEQDRLDTVFRVLILGFAYGAQALKMLHFKDVFRLLEINKRVKNESCLFRERLHFYEMEKGLYVSHIEPKSQILITLGPAFEDRMPSENWMIVDDVHSEAIIHPKDRHFYIQKLTEDELNFLIETEKNNDNYTDLWKLFFNTIAIKERTNKKCQDNHFPIWARKHIVEFQ
ncbi:MAG: TIGR03915 family putative DNA repair protein [Lachnospiraceae bacterium]|nr:TIGR03915 family putative DNA repair protein [Lachnospiraceae bacterium]